MGRRGLVNGTRVRLDQVVGNRGSNAILESGWRVTTTCELAIVSSALPAVGD
jgi:hypothetical protein